MCHSSTTERSTRPFQDRDTQMLSVTWPTGGRGIRGTIQPLLRRNLKNALVGKYQLMSFFFFPNVRGYTAPLSPFPYGLRQLLPPCCMISGVDQLTARPTEPRCRHAISVWRDA